MSLGPISSDAVRQLCRVDGGTVARDGHSRGPGVRRRQPIHGSRSPARHGRVGRVDGRRKSNGGLTMKNCQRFRRLRTLARFLSGVCHNFPTRPDKLLSSAAVIGKDFSVDMAADLAGMSTADAAAAIKLVRRQRLVWSRPTASSRSCTIRSVKPS